MGQYSESFSSHFYEERRKCIKFDIRLSSLPRPHTLPLHPHILIKTHEITSVIFPFSIWCAPSKASCFF